MEALKKLKTYFLKNPKNPKCHIDFFYFFKSNAKKQTPKNNK